MPLVSVKGTSKYVLLMQKRRKRNFWKFPWFRKDNKDRTLKNKTLNFHQKPMYADNSLSFNDYICFKSFCSNVNSRPWFKAWSINDCSAAMDSLLKWASKSRAGPEYRGDHGRLLSTARHQLPPLSAASSSVRDGPFGQGKHRCILWSWLLSFQGRDAMQLKHGKRKAPSSLDMRTANHSVPSHCSGLSWSLGPFGECALWIYFGDAFFFVLENYSAVILRGWLNYLHIAGDNIKMVELPAQSP